MPSAPPRWPARIAGVAVFVLVGVILAAGFLACLPRLRERAGVTAQAAEAAAALEQEQERGRALKDKIATIKADPRELERLAREKFGLGRAGETIFLFEPPRADPSAPARP